ncbi:hypothetical protein EHEL_060525 [Encephalitozoon hellem ATCC 50504]|uniref:uncharacterized protein n=1 Tax=Encephalitozoon hellem (strain ATCC 50504) TaxID=907965 RepID=UPI00042E36D1|nr:uncharacterized protein EHEL_060525 [Encephalitozoon hellem ATCC 50504]AHL28939.1 hypothetical protein EHEL_060525 [Encephalitozoon hellem ATCC 50504]
MKFIVGIVSLFAASVFSSSASSLGSSSRYYSRSVSSTSAGSGYPFYSPYLFYRSHGAFGPYSTDASKDSSLAGTTAASPLHY